METSSFESIYATSQKLVAGVNTGFHRYLYDKIQWKNKLIGIKGARGVGKTTLVLQHIKENFADNPEKALYVSLDNMWFANHTLSDIVDYHYTQGGTHIFIDEIHRYPHWQRVIKNITDEYPDLNIVYTGSSMLRMDNAEADLSRRQIVYTLTGMSFREFLEFDTGLKQQALAMDDILKRHVSIAMDIYGKTKILQHFNRYLKFGYYPFYKSEIDSFAEKLLAVINVIINEDLPAVEDITFATRQKTRRMLMILAERVPQTPKMSDLYASLETNREQGLRMLSMLEKAALLQTLSTKTKNLKSIVKPDKIYLNNTNLMFALSQNADVGTMRETFFINQLSATAVVNYPPQGDFIVNDRYLFEVGGKSKTFDQIKDLPDSYLAIDNIETGHAHRIPLWMFGLMY